MSTSAIALPPGASLTGNGDDVQLPRSLDGAVAAPVHRTLAVFRMDRRARRCRPSSKLKPIFGYLHRKSCHEKIAEDETYLGSMPYTDRLDYFCSLTNNWAYALAVETLAGITVPERAQYLRRHHRRAGRGLREPRLPHRLPDAGHGRQAARR